MQSARITRAFLTAASALLLATNSHAQVAGINYVATELPRPEWPQDVQIADMDGDGLQDVIVPFWSADAGRQLHIYLQQTDQRFPAQASRIVDIRSEIVAVALADVRPEPGSELLLFTGSTAFSLSSAVAGYSGNLRRLFDWSLSSAVPDPQVTRFLSPPVDANADGFVDLLLPGVDDYGWFTGGPDEQFTLRHQFSTVNTEVDDSDLPPPSGRFSTNISFNAQDGLLVDVQLRSGSLFEDFLQVGSSQADAILDIRNWMPPAVMAPLSAANSHDLIYLNIGNDIQGQINILSMNSAGSFAERPDWQAPVEMRGDFKLLDVNGDGLSDIVRLVEDGNSWTVSFYVNTGGTFNFAQANQVMRFSGYDLRVDVTPITGGKPQLSVSYYTIPVVAAIRDASIVRSLLLFNHAATGPALFNNRPDFLLEETFSASTVRGLSSPIVLDADLDGDGRIDALHVTPAGALAAKRINSNLQFENQPFWQYVPTRSIARFRVMDMNNDGRPDLVLDHSNTVTVLVSAP
ncbi:MAG: VCBS repeat-containing protein [Pseudohongiella sp.]|nr:VCBS repeat-containing protein [Pseudohongiella sp.]